MSASAGALFVRFTNGLVKKAINSHKGPAPILDNESAIKALSLPAFSQGVPRLSCTGRL